MSIIKILKSSFLWGYFQENDVSCPLFETEHRRIRKIGRYISGETIFFGKKFKFVDSVTFLSSFDEIFRNKVYEFKTNSLKPVIIDCGANIGLATIYFKRNFPNAEIIAYEPDPNIFNVLKENIENQAFFGVSLRNEAVSIKDGVINFFMEGAHSGMIVQDNLDKKVVPDEKVVPIRCCRLKTVLQEFEEIAFLKIDIEGHERYLIPDVAEEIKKVDFLFLEYHSFIDKDQNLEEILKIISDAGFRYYIKESYNKTLPFINREIFLKMDLLLNIFCYRDNNCIINQIKGS